MLTMIHQISQPTPKCAQNCIKNKSVGSHNGANRKEDGVHGSGGGGSGLGPNDDDDSSAE